MYHIQLLRKGNLNLNHFKIFFPCTTLRASPIHGHLSPSGARRDAVVRSACGLVIDPAADQAHPGFRRIALTHALESLSQKNPP